MPRTDDGEFELILGNKQLLSVFFIVVVLLGIFFTMGYIVGKNSAPDVASAGRTEPIMVDPAAGPHPTPRASATPAGPETADPSRVSIGSAKTPPVKPTQSASATPSPTPAPAAKADPAKASGQIMLSPGGEPSAGQTYLQVVASTRPDCEIISDVLKRKGFSTVVAPGPNEKVFRVLVGPLSDREQIAKTRTDLETAGFKNPYLRKY